MLLKKPLLPLLPLLLPLLEANPNVDRYFWCATTFQQASQFPFLEGSELLRAAGDPPVQYTPVGEYFRGA